MNAAARVVLRPIASPLPLGFLALAAGTLLVSGLQLGWLAPEQGSDVALILLAFVFPLQLVASVFGFLARDVVAGTGMGLLCGTWLSVGLVTLTAEVPGATSDALGLFLLLAGTAMLVPFAAATTGKLVPAAVLGDAALALALEDARGSTVLPLGRRGPGEHAFTGGLDAQLDGVEHAAGVRRQL